jgi:hypothetical protein
MESFSAQRNTMLMEKEHLFVEGDGHVGFVVVESNKLNLQLCLSLTVWIKHFLSSTQHLFEPPFSPAISMVTNISHE